MLIHPIIVVWESDAALYKPDCYCMGSFLLAFMAGVGKCNEFGTYGPASGNKCALHSVETNGSISDWRIWL